MTKRNELVEKAPRQRMTVPEFRDRKQLGPKLALVTAYDFPSAQIADLAGVDAVLVGDSVGTVVLGYSNVIPVTLEDVLYHCKAVRRGLRHPLLIADLPFGTYQASAEQAVLSAARLLKEGGAQAVKLEGGAAVATTIRRLVDAGIPVMGHLGLTPQSLNALGGHKVQGRVPEQAARILQDAAVLDQSGVFGLVLETIPAQLAGQVTASVGVPTVGIGAGPQCDGQIQVWHDMLGITTRRVFHHVGRYAALADEMQAALTRYSEDVRNGRFPGEEQSL